MRSAHRKTLKYEVSGWSKLYVSHTLQIFEENPHKITKIVREHPLSLTFSTKRLQERAQRPEKPSYKNFWEVPNEFLARYQPCLNQKVSGLKKRTKPRDIEKTKHGVFHLGLDYETHRIGSHYKNIFGKLAHFESVVRRVLNPDVSSASFTFLL